MEVDPVSFLSYTPVYDDATLKIIENDFSRVKDECYLDHAGATLYSDTQIKNVTVDLHRSLYANPHSIGGASYVTQDIIERTRYKVLRHFNTSADEYSVIFTSGATASLKIIAESFSFHKNERDPSSNAGHFAYTQDNHTSVLGMREIISKRGARVTCLSHGKVFDVFNESRISVNQNANEKSNSLFVFPAQSNFSGLKYPLSWIQDIHDGALFNVLADKGSKWHVLLDAAAFVSTNDLDLSIYKPDFVCISFYKMFGYPTGIGALLVKNSSAHVLEKCYYGGGTVDVALSTEMFHVKRGILHQKFEDGTLPFLSIISLGHGFDVLKNIGTENISKHVFSLARYLHHSLLTLHHSNGRPVVKIYSDTDYEDPELQGGIVTFNLTRSNGEFVGYMEVMNMASLFKIHLRTGCFCNPGACQRHLSLSNKEVLENYDAGYVCGGAADLINGKPTGAVRISFGYMSTIKDIRTLIKMIKECFVDQPSSNKIPSWWPGYKLDINDKFNRRKRIKETKTSTQDNRNIISNLLENIKVTMDNIVLEKRHFKSPTVFNESKHRCTLEKIFIYPIKSCAAFEIHGSWKLNSKGLEYDREWMIMTSAGACLTQKQHINLCLLEPMIFKDTKMMRLSYPGMPTIDVSLDQNFDKIRDASICQSRVCGHKVEGTDCGSEVSEWLSLALGKPNLRLIRQSANENTSKPSNKPELSFSSQAQYLLINPASVKWISDKIPDAEVDKNTILHRFRGNIILSGCEPFDETHWEEITIGKNKFVVSGPCARCQMICIDQKTGKKTVEPLRTLAENLHGKLKFGIYLRRESKDDGIINIGDPVEFI